MASFDMKSLYTNKALTEVLLCLNYFLNLVGSFMNKERNGVAVGLRPTFDWKTIQIISKELFIGD